MKDIISVLDKGYVRLVDTMGSDLTVVNAARCSFDKESKEMSFKDEKLIKFLASHNHTSPFRHCTLQFEIKAPLMICRQHWKYVVGSGFQEGTGDPLTAWNEMSKRYVTEEPSFYVPGEDEWRGTPDNKKQGSGDPVLDKLGKFYTQQLMKMIDEGERRYYAALEDGICAEQARLFLPSNGMYTRYYWTASLQAVSHFLNQRLAHDSQREIQEYAKAVYDLTKDKFPVSLEHLVKNN